jgi:hypothetical protein
MHFSKVVVLKEYTIARLYMRVNIVLLLVYCHQ